MPNSGGTNQGDLHEFKIWKCGGRGRGHGSKGCTRAVARTLSAVLRPASNDRPDFSNSLHKQSPTLQLDLVGLWPTYLQVTRGWTVYILSLNRKCGRFRKTSATDLCLLSRRGEPVGCFQTFLWFLATKYIPWDLRSHSLTGADLRRTPSNTPKTGLPTTCTRLQLVCGQNRPLQESGCSLRRKNVQRKSDL
jgi:hypothetical protein